MVTNVGFEFRNRISIHIVCQITPFGYFKGSLVFKKIYLFHLWTLKSARSLRVPWGDRLKLYWPIIRSWDKLWQGLSSDLKYYKIQLQKLTKSTKLKKRISKDNLIPFLILWIMKLNFLLFKKLIAWREVCIQIINTEHHWGHWVDVMNSRIQIRNLTH